MVRAGADRPGSLRQLGPLLLAGALLGGAALAGCTRGAAPRPDDHRSRLVAHAARHEAAASAIESQEAKEAPRTSLTPRSLLARLRGRAGPGSRRSSAVRRSALEPAASAAPGSVARRRRSPAPGRPPARRGCAGYASRSASALGGRLASGRHDVRGRALGTCRTFATGVRGIGRQRARPCAVCVEATARARGSDQRAPSGPASQPLCPGAMQRGTGVPSSGGGHSDRGRGSLDQNENTFYSVTAVARWGGDRWRSAPCRSSAGPARSPSMVVEVTKRIFTRPFQFREFIEQAWFITSVTLMPTILVSHPVRRGHLAPGRQPHRPARRPVLRRRHRGPRHGP